MRNRLIVIFFLLISSFSVFSQQVIFKWAAKIEGDYDETNRFMSVDDNDNVYVCGSFTSNSLQIGSIYLKNTGLNDLYIAKYNSKGDVLWAKSAEGDDKDGCSGVAIDNKNGYIYIAGNFSSYSLKLDNFVIDNSSYNYSEDYLAKINAFTGQTVWLKKVINNSSSSNSIQGICTDSEGNIYTVGIYQDDVVHIGSLTFYNSNPSCQNVLVVKSDKDGNPLWAKSIDGDNNEVSFAITCDSHDNVIVSGYYQSTVINLGSFQLTNTNNNANVFIVKYDSDGDELWAKGFGGNGTDISNCIGTDKNDNIYLGGYFDSSMVNIDGTPLYNPIPGIKSFFLVKYNAVGKLIWAKCPDSANGSSSISSLAVDGNNEIIAVGSFSAKTLKMSNKTLSLSNASQDPFILMFDDSGNTKVAKTISGNNSGDINSGLSACSNNKNSIYIGGDYYSSILGIDNIQLTNSYPGYKNVFFAPFEVTCDTISETLNFCNGNTLSLTAKSDYDSYSWYNSKGVLVGTHQAIDIASPVDGEIYTCKMQNEFCLVIYSVSLKLFPQNNLIINGNPEFCKGSFTILTASGGSNYHWSTGETSASIQVSKAGDYQVTTINDYGCSQTISLSVIESEQPSADFTITPGKLSTSEPTVNCSVANPEAGVTYTWDMGDGTVLTGNSVNHTYELTLTTIDFTISLSATNHNGCMSELKKKISVSVDVPNVFTPNGDGVDDVFMENVDLQIIDRYGVVLYKGNEGWDGTYKGTKMKPDTYFYYIKYTDQTGKAYTKTGYVTLIR